MFTIEDLREGRCAVINDGTLEELKEVLELAFPDSETIAGGGYKYYFLDKQLYEESSKYIWDIGNKTKLPTQSVKDFLPKELKRGDLVWVSDSNSGERILQLILLTEIKGAKYPFVCVVKADTINFRSGEPFDMTSYKYATKVEEPKEVEMTIEEIEKALNKWITHLIGNML